MLAMLNYGVECRRNWLNLLSWFSFSFCRFCQLRLPFSSLYCLWKFKFKYVFLFAFLHFVNGAHRTSWAYRIHTAFFDFGTKNIGARDREHMMMCADGGTGVGVYVFVLAAISIIHSCSMPANSCTHAFILVCIIHWVVYMWPVPVRMREQNMT